MTNIDHYVDNFGQIKRKEFICCSHGIAKTFYEKHKTQLYNHDYIVYNGRKFPLFEYYNRLLDKDPKKDYNTLKLRREQNVTTLTKLEAKAKDYNLKQKFSKTRGLTWWEKEFQEVKVKKYSHVLIIKTKSEEVKTLDKDNLILEEDIDYE